MPIVLPTAPRIDEGIVEQHLLRIAKSTATGPPGQLLNGPPDRLSYTDPHRNYTVTLDALSKGQLLAAASATTWRYLIVNQEKGVGELELASNIDADGNEVNDRFVALHHGEACQCTLDVLHSAESDGAIQDGDYELRFLSVASLYFDAVWLHSRERDFVIPINDRTRTLRKGQTYSEGDILGVLQPLALNAQRFDAELESRDRRLK